MWEISTGGVVWNIAWWLTLWAILAYFGTSQETLIILTAVLLLDWIFWVVNAYLQWNLQSKLMATWLIKKVSRWGVPFIVITILKGAGFQDIEFISTAMLSILIVAEWYSIIWHIYSINYKENLPEIDALKLLLQWIWKLFKWRIDDSLKDK